MGEATPNTTRGTFFFYTNQDSPHAKIKNESIACATKISLDIPNAN